MDGQWFDAKAHVTLPDPMNGDPFIRVPNPTTADTQPFVDSLKRVPKTGLHNPFKVRQQSRVLVVFSLPWVDERGGCARACARACVFVAVTSGGLGVAAVLPLMHIRRTPSAT